MDSIVKAVAVLLIFTQIIQGRLSGNGTGWTLTRDDAREGSDLLLIFPRTSGTGAGKLHGMDTKEVARTDPAARGDPRTAPLRHTPPSPCTATSASLRHLHRQQRSVHSEE